MAKTMLRTKVIFPVAMKPEEAELIEAARTTGEKPISRSAFLRAAALREARRRLRRVA